MKIDKNWLEKWSVAGRTEGRPCSLFWLLSVFQSISIGDFKFKIKLHVSIVYNIAYMNIYNISICI